MSELMAAKAKDQICFKINYESMIDRIKAQPDIFRHPNKYLKSK